MRTSPCMKSGSGQLRQMFFNIVTLQSKSRPKPEQVLHWRPLETISAVEHHLCLELFIEVQHAMHRREMDGDHVAMIMAEARCAQQSRQVKMVRVEIRASKLLTQQPQLHAAVACR